MYSCSSSEAKFILATPDPLLNDELLEMLKLHPNRKGILLMLSTTNLASDRKWTKSLKSTLDYVHDKFDNFSTHMSDGRHVLGQTLKNIRSLADLPSSERLALFNRGVTVDRYNVEEIKASGAQKQVDATLTL